MPKSPAQLQREIDAALRSPPSSRHQRHSKSAPPALTAMKFTEILSGVRDNMLAEMRDGFWREGTVRYDATSWDLNNGGCIEFAERAVELIGDRYPEEKIAQVALEQFDPDLAHDVVKWRGKFYDAECVTGASKWRDLPVVRNRKKTREQVLLERGELTLGERSP